VCNAALVLHLAPSIFSMGVGGGGGRVSIDSDSDGFTGTVTAWGGIKASGGFSRPSWGEFSNGSPGTVFRRSGTALALSQMSLKLHPLFNM
jgi:hypothetical protein